MSQDQVSGLTVWVTGATSGIGNALVGKLVGLGNFVIASGRNAGKLAELEDKHGDQIATFVCDVGHADSVSQAESQLHEITDYIDLVIACAGVCDYEDDLSFDLDIYEKAFQVNFLGVIRTLKASTQFLNNSEGRAQFIAVGSLSSALPFPRAEAYGSSKAALEYFVKSCRIDSAKQKWSIKLIRPGFVDTPMVSQNDFPMPFKMSPDETADRIIQNIANDKVVVDFPRRLSWILRSVNLLGGLWIKLAANKLSRPA